MVEKKEKSLVGLKVELKVEWWVETMVELKAQLLVVWMVDTTVDWMVGLTEI